jgi:hypothetical protein
MLATWLAALLGCAEGMPGPGASASGSLMADPPVSGTAAPSGGTGTAGAGGAAGRAEPPPAFTGEPCNMGDMQDCTCAEGGEGTKVCRFDADSPTMGAFGPCGSCAPAAAPPGAGQGASGMGSAGGSAPMAGTGGRGGAGGGGTAGMPQSGSSGGGGMGASGSGGGQPEPPAGCNPRDCDEPLLGSACCTDDDECGVRLLISCNPR